MFRTTIITVLAVGTLAAAALTSASASGPAFPRGGNSGDRFVAHKQAPRAAGFNVKGGSGACTHKPKHFHWYSVYVARCPKW